MFCQPNSLSRAGGRGSGSRVGGRRRALEIFVGVPLHELLRVLQHLDFDKAKDANGLALELQRMIEDAIVSNDEAELVPRDSLAWFLGTGLAERMTRSG